jgi:type II secretion system protein J
MNATANFKPAGGVPVPRNSRAFSLIELTLAMAMVAMLALSLYTSMYVAKQARRSAMAAIEPARTAALAGDLIAQELQSVVRPSANATDLAQAFIASHIPSGASSADSVEFYAIGSDDKPNDSPFYEGIRKVDLLLRTDVNPPVLVKQTTRNLLAAVQAQPEQEILCRNVRSFEMKYYDGTAWQDEWDSTTLNNTLPLAVSFTIVIEPPGNTDPMATPITVTRVIPLPTAAPITQ